MRFRRLPALLAALVLAAPLSAAALDRIDDMFAKDYLTSRRTGSSRTWADERGYSYREFGENLAVGYPTAEAVVDGWMHSPGHRANVLSRAFEETGVAIEGLQPGPANGRASAALAP